MADERLMTMNGDKVAALVISIVVVKPELRRLSCMYYKEKMGLGKRKSIFADVVSDCG